MLSGILPALLAWDAVSRLRDLVPLLPPSGSCRRLSLAAPNGSHRAQECVEVNHAGQP